MNSLGKAMRWARSNWFQLVVILLLFLCYVRLGHIEDNAFYTADVVDSSATRIINSSEQYLNDIVDNTRDTYFTLEDRLR